ncbi:hypothetical protein TNCV_3326671 [Trichonephila clavipes]|nr:hypothetical protein TNCV_3326671 [Trichonephila clavipes]
MRSISLLKQLVRAIGWHHLYLQGRRDYTPADTAARTCWLGCPRLLYYLEARDAKLSFSPVPSKWSLSPRPHLISQKAFRSLKPHSKCQFSQGAVCCVTIPVVKNHHTQLHYSQFWSATALHRNRKGSGRRKGESKEVMIARERRVRETRTQKRVSPCQKITRVPRDCETHTHLKKTHYGAGLYSVLLVMLDGRDTLLTSRIPSAKGHRMSDREIFEARRD